MTTVCLIIPITFPPRVEREHGLLTGVGLHLGGNRLAQNDDTTDDAVHERLRAEAGRTDIGD
jgi:hypothetical protein